MGEKLQLESISSIRHLAAENIVNVRLESGLSATRHCLSSAPVKEFVSRLRTEKMTYDVMLIEDYYQEALLYLAELIVAPVVALNPRSAAHISSHYLLGLKELNVYTFHDLLDPRVPSNSLPVHVNKKYLMHLQAQGELIKDHFELPAETVISFEHLYQRVVYLLSNSYPNFNPPSPVIYGKEMKIGGFYIRPPKELAKDIKDFLHDANYGAIFVTLPSQVYGLPMNMTVVKTLIEGFSVMKQKVLFEWDGPKVEDLPKNVLTRRHIPMSDILAHPYVQLMFCPGDIFHVQNSIQRMVPMVALPITKEQELLVDRAVVNGNIGRKMNLNEVTVEAVLNTTKEMFGNQMIIHQIHYVASFYRNKPLGAMEEAVFWVEYAGKHKTEARIYQTPVYQGSNVIPPYYTKLITVVGGLTVLGILVLLAVGYIVFKFYLSGPRKGDKKAV